MKPKNNSRVLIYHAELLSAWKTKGGDSVSDNEQKKPRIWFKIGIFF